MKTRCGKGVAVVSGLVESSHRPRWAAKRPPAFIQRYRALRLCDCCAAERGASPLTTGLVMKILPLLVLLTLPLAHADDGDDAMWWGAAAYLGWSPSDRATFTARFEGFRDRDGTRLGAPAILTDVTFGVDWRPIAAFPNLHLRPEVRWDHAWDRDFFDGGRARDQVSLTLGVIVTF